MGTDIADSNIPCTVIITTHNRANLLPRAVQSVLNQTMGEFEVLIVDDVSTDNTAEVVARFADPRIRYVRTEKQSKAAGARNLGAHCARGRILVFLDDDDELAPTFLERAADVMSDDKYGFAMVWKSVVLDKGSLNAPMNVRRLTITGEGQLEHREWFYRNGMPSGTGGLIVRRALYLSIGGCDETFVRMEDTDLLIRLVEEHDFTIIPENLYIMHMHGGNELERLIRLSSTVAEAFERLLAKHSHILARYPQIPWDFTKRAAQYYYLSGNRGTARQLMWKLLRNQPGKAEVWKSFLVYDVVGLLPREWYLAIFRYLYLRRRQIS